MKKGIRQSNSQFVNSLRWIREAADVLLDDVGYCDPMFEGV